MTSSASRRARRVEEDGSETFRAWARAELTRVTPPGWGQRRVKPPWAETAVACRACETSTVDLRVTMLTRLIGDRRTVLYVFALVCAECRGKSDDLSALGKRVLALP